MALRSCSSLDDVGGPEVVGEVLLGGRRDGQLGDELIERWPTAASMTADGLPLRCRGGPPLAGFGPVIGKSGTGGEPAADLARPNPEPAKTHVRGLVTTPVPNLQDPQKD